MNWDASLVDRYGTTSWSLGYAFNPMGLFSGSSNFQAVASSPKADGQYVVLTGGLTREQKLPGTWGLRLHADGQWANEPLVSNEQFSLGGQPGVRGYREGTDYGDSGWRFQFEPHSPYRNLGLVFERYPMVGRFYTFADYGEGYLIDPGSRKASVALLGSGCGFERQRRRAF